MTALFWAAITFGIAVVGACVRDPDPTPPFVPPSEKSAALHATPATPSPAPAPPRPLPYATGAPSPDAIGFPKQGWSKVQLKDEVPLCVFANVIERDNANFIELVKKQSLKANLPITIGAFGPHCINEQCDDLPSLQCWVERDDMTLNVHTRYSAYHKEGATCTENCRRVTASCDTPALEPGTYTIKHGERSQRLKIPNELKSPCLTFKSK